MPWHTWAELFTRPIRCKIAKLMSRAVFILWYGIATLGKPVSALSISHGGQHLLQCTLQDLASSEQRHAPAVLPSTSTGRWETGRANTGARSPPAPHGAQWPRLSQRLCVSPRCPSAPRRPTPRGPAHLLHRGLQHLPICGPVHGQHRVEAWERPRADHRDVGTVGLRSRIDAAFPSRRPGHTRVPSRAGAPTRQCTGRARRRGAASSRDRQSVPAGRAAGCAPSRDATFFRGSPRPWRGPAYRRDAEAASLRVGHLGAEGRPR